MRKSKYLGLVSGEWECTHVGVDCVQPAFIKKRDEYGNRVRSKYPGHQVYYYIFERPTSDGKAMKMVRLNATQARRVLVGKATVEELAEQKARERAVTFKNKVSYSFCD
jgi:hypothetical protein